MGAPGWSLLWEQGGDTSSRTSRSFLTESLSGSRSLRSLRMRPEVGKLLPSLSRSRGDSLMTRGEGDEGGLGGCVSDNGGEWDDRDLGGA